MSYNIRIGIGMDQQTNLKRIAEVINKVQPDYVGLQEVDSVCERSGWINQYAELAGCHALHDYAKTCCNAPMLCRQNPPSD